jgi:hypothetical protein
MVKVAEKYQPANSSTTREVAKALREVFSDPDFGLQLRPDFVRRMKKSQKGGQSRSLQTYLKS